MNIAWWVKRWSELTPEKTAVIFESERISYQALHQRVQRTCLWLESCHVQKGDRVAVFLDNCPEFIELYLACAWLGAVFVPINYRLAPPELSYTLANADPLLFIFGSETTATVMDLYPDRYLTSIQPDHPPLLIRVGQPERGTLSHVGDYHSSVAAFEEVASSQSSAFAMVSAEEPHVIMYTSGTTGRPKGAVLSHRKTFFNCLNTDIFFDLTGHDTMLVVLPLFHSGGLFIQASPILYKGATIVLHRKFEPRKIIDDIACYRVSKFLGVPTIYKGLLDLLPEEKADFESLKVAAIGGEQLTPELMARFREAGFSLRQVMGQTETSILLWASEEDAIDKPGSVGRPVFHAEVTIVDSSGNVCPPNQVGEIVVRGSVMMTEYWRDAGKTTESIRNGWLQTGDLAYRDADGYFFLVDRAKDMFISGGENVYPAEVERVLRTQPAVDEVAVIGVPDDKWNEVGCAFVRQIKGKSLSEMEVIRCCDGKLARFKWPHHVIFIDHFPRTALGKIRKSELRQQYRDQNSPLHSKELNQPFVSNENNDQEYMSHG
jgi:fatty-acyl-CoA synthase